MNTYSKGEPMQEELKDYDRLLNNISNTLHIERCNNKELSVYLNRIIYSAIGHVSLASLFDLNDDNEPITITHFKRRVETLFSSYKKMYSGLSWKSNKGIEMSEKVFADALYELFRNSGHFYHYSKHLLPAKKCEAVSENGIVFLRGQAPGQPVYRSGLGAYSNDCSTVYSKMTIQEMFHLPDESLRDYWNRIVSEYWPRSSKQHIDGLEYLRFRDFSSGYWIEHLNKDIQSDTILISRTNSHANSVYYFCQYADGVTSYSQLPSWLCADDAYRRLCNACLKANSHLPDIDFENSGNLIYFKLGYLLPPEELSLFMLYSWPCDRCRFGYRYDGVGNIIGFDPFNRCMVKSVFEALKPIYEHIGYKFHQGICNR